MVTHGVHPAYLALEKQTEQGQSDLVPRPRCPSEEPMIAAVMFVPDNASRPKHSRHRMLPDAQRPTGNHRNESFKAGLREARREYTDVVEQSFW